MQKRSTFRVICLIGFLMIPISAFIFCWKRPITYEMISIEGYYGWSQGERELSLPIFNAFTRDARFRGSLKGKPRDWLLQRFPEASDGSSYSSDSYRSIGAPTRNWDGQPVSNVLWLNGVKLDELMPKDVSDENLPGFCALLHEGKIVGFQWVKG